MEPQNLSVHTDMSFINLFMQASIFVKIIMTGLLAASVTVWAVWGAKLRQFKRLHAMADDFEDVFWSGSHTLDSFVRQVNPRQGQHPLASVFVVGHEEWLAASDSERLDGTALQR